MRQDWMVYQEFLLRVLSESPKALMDRASFDADSIAPVNMTKQEKLELFRVCSSKARPPGRI
jgi:hypothetical protein